MLTLGPGYDIASMIGSLPVYCPMADHLSSRTNTVRILKGALSRNPTDPAI
jgi:hypothetical protein